VNANPTPQVISLIILSAPKKRFIRSSTCTQFQADKTPIGIPIILLITRLLDYKGHQGRTIWLWEQTATRYKDNSWVAGYNSINEPCDPEHWRLPAFYDRLEPALRKVDPNHILWFDGNIFAMQWRFFNKALPNCVYALHDYTASLHDTYCPSISLTDWLVLRIPQR